ncbi:MAG: tetratricopeptide repeat protein, partial [Bryobacteraceae bacterium]
LLLSEDETRAAQHSKTDHDAQLTAVELAYLDESFKHYGGFRTTIPTGEFATLFSPSQATAPPPRTSEPGAFTQMFGPTAYPTPQQQPPPAQPPSPLGEFTGMFQAPPPLPIPQPQAPPSASTQPPRAPAPAARRSRIHWIAIGAIAVATLLTFGYFSFRAGKPVSPAAQVSLVDQAQAAVQNGAYDDAVKLFTQAIAAGQPAYADRAYAYRLSGNLDAAVADYQRAIQTGKADNQTYADQAYVLALKGDWKQSIQLLTDVIRINPSNVNYYVSRGRAYIAAGDFKAALSDFENALRRDPTSAAAQSGRADALKKLQLPVPAKDLPPRVYIQISSEVQRPQARRLQDVLTDLGYTAPPLEIVGQKSPAQNEVRFVHPEDQAQAEKLAADLLKANFGAVVRQIAAAKTGDARPRHFELWFAKVNAGVRPSPGAPAQRKAPAY